MGVPSLAACRWAWTIQTTRGKRRFAPGMPGMPMEVSSAAMPTYEYVCQSCGARFEAWQKITDDPIDVCPTCGEHVRRIIFPVGLVFKGSGFYVNDTRSHAPPPDVHSGSESSSGDLRLKETSASGETSGTGSGESGQGKEASPATANTSSSSDSSGSAGKARVSDTAPSSASRPASGD